MFGELIESPKVDTRDLNVIQSVEIDDTVFAGCFNQNKSLVFVGGEQMQIWILEYETFYVVKQLP